jgi:nicotinamide-nucleotide adenylyltransferase
MAATEAAQTNMRVQLSKFKSALSSFASSSDNFRILSSIPQNTVPPPPQTLYILDSSFNPPTRAHLQIATSALTDDRGAAPKRLLLLLATQNADKAPKPASFEQRLLLMSIFARDLLNTLPKSPIEAQPAIDIGVTKFPYFHDKSVAIVSSNLYPSNPTQVHLTGFDTLIRILNAKYYPPEHNLRTLEPFLSQHRMRVTYRTDADWGSREGQDAYLRDLAEGKREHEGGKGEWASMIELVEGKKPGEEIISSTKVREALKNGDRSTLKNLVTDGVGDLILTENPYLEKD